MTRTYSKDIPDTYKKFVNAIIAETRAPRDMVEDLFIPDEVEVFIDEEDPTEHNETLDVWMKDVDIRIELLYRIKHKLENWKK